MSTNTFVNPKIACFDAEAQPVNTPAMAKFSELAKFRASSKFVVGESTPIAVSPFGPLGQAKAGFGYVHVDVKYSQISGPTGNPVSVPGLALVRGDSVAMLPFLNVGDIDYVVLTEQARLPIGETNYLEIPAGMSDAAVGKSGYAAAIAKEMEEEVGLTLDRSSEFIEIGTIIPSAGGCDERIRLYWTRVNCSPDVLQHLNGRLGGALLENEQITARIVPIDSIRSQILDGTLTDAKLITALWFYDNRKHLHTWSCSRNLTMDASGKPTLVV